MHWELKYPAISSPFSGLCGINCLGRSECELINPCDIWYSSVIRSKMNRVLDPDQNEESAMLGQATSFVYAAWWMYKFFFRQAIVGRLLPWVMGILFVVELLGPLTHLGELPSSLRRVLSLLLLLTALVLIYHHQRLRFRIGRHNVLLSSTMVLLEDESVRHPDHRTGRDASLQSIADTLQALAFAVEYGDPTHVVNASVLLRSRSGEPFHLLCQDPRGAFRADLALHPLNSVAGKVSEEAIGALLYVPRTDFVHAVRIAQEQGVAGGKIFRTARMVPNAFQRLGTDPAVLKSLLCVKIPIEPTRGDEGVCAVLCLSRDMKDAMGDLEFHAIKVAAALISINLSKDPSIITERNRVNYLRGSGYY
jgi:hypothetical protein